jgi:hypothetical protein
LFTWTAKQRKAIYGISAALVPVLVAFGFVSDTQGATILGAVGAIFNSVLAFKNVSDQ